MNGIQGNEPNTILLASILEKARGRLLDQTRRNRLLNYKETARDVAVLDEDADGIFNHLAQDGKVFYFDFRAEPEEEAEQGQLVFSALPEFPWVPQHLVV